MSQTEAVETATQTLSVADIAMETSGVFEPIVEEMMAVRGAASDLTHSAKTLAEAVSSAGQELESNSQHCGSLLLVEVENILQRIQQLDNVCKEQDVRSLCGQILSQTKELNAFSSLTLIVTVQVDDNEVFDREAFTRDVRELCDRLKGAVDDVQNALSSYQSVRFDILRNLQLAKTDLTVAISDSTTTFDSEAENAARQASNQVAELRAKVTEEMSALVACMQHPDAFRQRAEHVDEMLKMTPDLCEADTSSVSILAGAHCRDMARKLAEVIGNAQGALETMAFTSSEAVERFEKLVDVKKRVQHLDAQRAVVRDLVASVSQTKENTAKALQGLEWMNEKVTEAGELLRSLVAERDAVHYSALNAEIAARHLGERTKGMSTVASETRETAMACAKSIQQLTELFSALVEATQAIDSSRLRETFDSLESAMRDDEELLEKALETGKVISQATLEAKDRMAGLASTARSAGNKLGQLESCVSTTQQLAQSLASADTTTLPDALARQIFDSYTMEEERLTHRSTVEIVGGIAETEPTKPQETEAAPDLASVLF